MQLQNTYLQKTYRRRSKPFQNGHLCGETGSWSNETWKSYSFNPLEKEVCVKFEQKKPRLTQLSRGPSDLNQRSKVNQSFSGDPGAVRGGRRDSSQLSQCEPRFSSVDIASQMVQQGSVPHSLFAGRGLAMVSNSHGQSCSQFPNGGLDTFHRFGLQGTYSLSQLNLPLSLSSGNLSAAPVGTGSTLATSVVTNTLLNSKGPHGKNNKDEVGGIDSAAADFYDPDQPLWRNDSHTSTGLQSTSQPNVKNAGSLLDRGLSGNHPVGRSDGSDNDLVTSRGAVASLKTRSSVQGRITSIKKRTEMGENIISKTSPSNIMQNETTSNYIQDPPHCQKMNNSDSSLKVQSGVARMNLSELLFSSLKEKKQRRLLWHQKRNDFRRKLDELEKKATAPKAEVAPEQLAKNEFGILAYSAKAAAPSAGDHDVIVPSAQDAVVATGNKSVGLSGKQSCKINLALALPESSSLKSSPLSFVNLGSPVVNNRFKLDNRPTAFKVVPPLPDGFAEFSPNGDLSNVQLDNTETSKAAAQIYFRTRHAAEKAFWGCKSWKGHNLQFVWLNSSNSRKDCVSRQSSSPFSKENLLHLHPGNRIHLEMEILKKPKSR
ncbi:hypothetical protein SSX86_014640 [Deinandra increscens subsp. villosa]|uniref:Uncharacterized protein n=1 Tax=Deinandra increscens subsp. villosa TaxID=3103831 RepID=A0AAP0D9T7_9ASTR